jgi:hypothetical protein
MMTVLPPICPSSDWLTAALINEIKLGPTQSGWCPLAATAKAREAGVKYPRPTLIRGIVVSLGLNWVALKCCSKHSWRRRRLVRC